MFNLLFCCCIKVLPNAPTPDVIEIIPPVKGAYRPDSIQPFSESDKKFFAELKRKKVVKLTGQ